MGGSRRALVWVPPGLTAETEPLPVLYLLDGLDYRDFGRVHSVAENLLAAGRLPPFFLVLVPPVDRSAEYGRNEAFERFLVTELVPAVEARWPTRKDPAGRGVMGVSLGAFAALSLTAGRGLSVVAPPGLTGTVTATLRDVPWDQALDLVLAGNGWGFVREGTVIRIVRRDDPAR